MNVPTEVTDNSIQESQLNGVKSSVDELTLRLDSFHEQNSSMNEKQKAEKRAKAPSLYSLFQKTLESKGDYPLDKCEWNTEKELQVGELPAMTLHSFLLQAESLGKKITFSKSLKIQITD